MSDINTVWDGSLVRGDWVLNGAQLAAGSDLQTALLISLFSDREAQADDEIPDGTNNPRGWWGDAGQQYKIGSRLWLLSRAKQSKETLQRANAYIAEALQWMLDDGVVARFDVTTEWTHTSELGARVVAYRNDGTSMALNFASVWKGIN